jgi:hypothetical protein
MRRCDVPGCKSREPVTSYPQGDYCPPHARMMVAPRSMWAAEGVPFPSHLCPPARPPQLQLTRPVRTRLGGWLEVVYAPCPRGCGRHTCTLPGSPIPPCLTCETTPNHHEEGKAA